MKLTNRFCLILMIAIMIFACPPYARAQSDPPQPQTFKLTITPADEASPALKYQLKPEFLDQTPGNAVPLYYQALQTMPEMDSAEFTKNITDMLDIPARNLPVKQVQETLSQYDSTLHQLSLAVHREKCEWDLPIRIEGIEMLLPALGDFRNLARVVALKARLQTARGDYDGTVQTLKSGFTLAQHISQGGTLINDLVAIAIASVMLNEVQQIAQEPGSPNLYWALAGLHPPFIDIRFAISVERDLLFLEFPDLKDPQSSRVSLEQLYEFLNLLNDGIIDQENIYQIDENKMQEFTKTEEFSKAQQYLMDLGLTADQVKNLPPGQIIIRYQLHEYNQIRDEMFKWFNVPYHQALPPMKKSIQQLEEKIKASQNNLLANLFLTMLPALDRAYLTMAKLDRNIAAHQYVEAVRMYTAEHNGALPKNAAAITRVPLPLDPVTGKNFTYSLQGNIAVIEGAAPPDEDISQGIRIELTIKK
ncbi:MAG: hypothetical protein GY869_18615 [Planctomycetes bacterium]|nr:hypothetical protein [Planctomycetota bacterium]